jgi:hypothetical protein
MDVDATTTNNTAATTGAAAMSAEERFELMLLAMTGQPDEEHDEPGEGWGVEDDWKRYDHVDHEAAAAYWDEIAVDMVGGI